MENGAIAYSNRELVLLFTASSQRRFVMLLHPQLQCLLAAAHQQNWRAAAAARPSWDATQQLGLGKGAKR